VVLEGWGGDLIGAVIGWGVLMLAVLLSSSSRGRVDPVHPGCMDQLGLLLAVDSLVWEG